jgi:hypothetical protein
MILSRTQILSAHDIGTLTVPVPEWGGDVIVRGMSGTERDAFEASVVSMRNGDTAVDMRNVRAKLVATCVIGEDGKRLFTDEDVTELGEKSASAINRVFEVAQRLSGLTKEDVTALGKASASAASAALGSG